MGPGDVSCRVLEASPSKPTQGNPLLAMVKLEIII